MREVDILYNGTKELFEEFFKKDTNKKQRANMWTFTRLVLPFLITITSSCSFNSTNERDKRIYMASSFILAGFAGITDYMDGKSARKYNSVSEYGKLLDQVADKVFAFLLGLNLTNYDPSYLRIVIGEMFIAGINLYYKNTYEDLEMESSFIGKIKEWPLFITIALGYASCLNSDLIQYKDMLLNITSIMQFMSICSYVKENNDKVKKLKLN